MDWSRKEGNQEHTQAHESQNAGKQRLERPLLHYFYFGL
jgi:hypothetical protein